MTEATCYIVANSPAFCGRLPHFELASRRFPHYDKSPTFLPHIKLIAQMIKLSEKSTIRCNPQLENQENACVPMFWQAHIFDHYANFRPNLGQTRSIKTRKAPWGWVGSSNRPQTPNLLTRPLTRTRMLTPWQKSPAFIFVKVGNYDIMLCEIIC